METIDITKLTPEQLQDLAAQLDAVKKSEKETRAKNLATLEELANDTVPEAFAVLKDAADKLQAAKTAVFHLMKDYLQLKVEAFEAKSLQKTHTISSGNKTITLGYRVTDGYKDDANFGIAMVHKFLGSLASDEKSKKLLTTVYRLLSKNAKGDLDSKKILELAKIANQDFPHTEFQEGIEIIQGAYQPKMSRWFIEASEIDGSGIEKNIPLSITSADLPADFDLSFLLPKTEENE